MIEFGVMFMLCRLCLDSPAITLEHLTLIADNHHGAQDLDQYAGFLKFPLGAMG